MEVERREGESVYLRGWGDYQRYSLKLTESELPGLGHMAIRAWSRADALRAPRRRDRAQPAAAIGWIDGDRGHGPAYRFTDPDGHRYGAVLRDSSATRRPKHLRPALKNVPQRYIGRGAAVKRLDHVNLLAADVARQPPVRRRKRSASASTSRSCSTTAPRPAPG